MVDILRRLEEQPFHWPVGRIIFQKIAYIATEEGIPTGLKYTKSSYGPFSKDLKELTVKLINNGLISEERYGKMFKIKVGPTYKDAKKEFSFELGNWEPTLEKTSDLFMRINTRQAELLTTVLFSYKSLLKKSSEKPAAMDVVNNVMQWKKLRRPQLNENEVAVTVRNLAALDWIQAKASADLPLPQENLVGI